MRALRLQWSWAFNLVCEVALSWFFSSYDGHNCNVELEVAIVKIYVVIFPNLVPLHFERYMTWFVEVFGHSRARSE